MNEPASTSSSSTGKFIAFAGALIALCCLGILCYSATLFYVVDKNISIIPTPTIDLACTDTICLNICIRQLPDFVIAPLSAHRAELAKKQGGYELVRYRLDESNSQLTNIVTSSIPDYLKIYQVDSKLHHRIWDYFTKIYPNSPEIHLSYMVVYMDASADGPAASISDLGGKWRLYVNLLDFDSPQAVTEILTHEYGHMLTLNKTQVQNITNQYGAHRKQSEFDKMRAMCQNRFFAGFDCASEKSYLNAFGTRFWSGEVYDAWVKIFVQTDQGANATNQAIDEFYAKYSNQFVRAYAATNPLEDIADSWTKFVLYPKPNGNSIANQKVLFFYDYPELVQMRTKIMQGICQNAAEHK